MKPQLLIACDFDGTVTRQDTLVEILDRFGSAQWRKTQDQVVAGALSIREGLQQEMGTVQADEATLREFLKDRIELAAGFPSFFRKMRRLGVPLVLLSGGFDLCVETVMTQAGLWPAPVLANRLSRKNGSWQVEYPYPSAACSACGHCNADPIRAWNQRGYVTVFAGNGVTDRCAAPEAGLTFAKDELGDWCRTQGIPYVPFGTFEDLDRELTGRGWI